MEFANFYDNENDSLENDNFTAPSFDNENSQISPVIWVALILYSLVFLVGVLGNGAVIWVMGFQMRQTVNSVWFLNLAVADLICCLALPILTAPLVSAGQWFMRDFACKLFSSLTILNMFASVLLLMVISVDRCALVVKTVWCQNHRSVSMAWKLCGVAWGFALLLTIPTFITRKTKDNILQIPKCVVDYASLSDNHHMAEVAVVVTRFLFAFLIPFIVITICYGLLICRVRSSRFMRSKKTLKVVLVVIVGFFVCWTPYHVTALILASEEKNSALYRSVNLVDPLIVGLAYINSCINPIIYVIAGQDFKTKMAKSLKAVLRNVLSEDVTLANSLAEGHAQTTYTTTEDRSTSTNI